MTALRLLMLATIAILYRPLNVSATSQISYCEERLRLAKLRSEDKYLSCPLEHEEIGSSIAGHLRVLNDGLEIRISIFKLVHNRPPTKSEIQDFITKGKVKAGDDEFWISETKRLAILLEKMKR